MPSLSDRLPARSPSRSDDLLRLIRYARENTNAIHLPPVDGARLTIRFRIFTYYIYFFHSGREWCRVCVCAERTIGRLHLLLVRTRWNCSRKTSVWAVCGDYDCVVAVVVNKRCLLRPCQFVWCESRSVVRQNSSRRS